MLKQGGPTWPSATAASPSPTVELVRKEISVTGNLGGNVADLSDLMKLVTEGRVKLQTKTYPKGSGPAASGRTRPSRY
jgi:D-arabinose 1-dehydrogenase-like Zn-dependent alcohol dehydrogenase